MSNTNDSQIEAFRTSVAGRLGIDDPSNEAILKALDRKLAAAARAPSEPATRAQLDIEDRLYEIAWPSRPAGSDVDRADDQQLNDAAWGSTTEQGA